MKCMFLTGAIAVSAAVLVACSLRLKAEATGTPFGSAEVEIEIDYGTGCVSVAPSEGFPPGTCVKLTWHDGSGNSLGSSETTVGGEPVEAPEGTEGVSVGPCDPPKKAKRSRLGGIVAQGDETFPYREIPIDFSDGKGRWVEFTIQAPDQARADAMAQAFRASMLQEPCAPQVSPYVIAEAELLSDGQIRYSIFTTQAPTSLDFQWNGNPLFTLDDASIGTANGWYAVSVFVPANLVETPFLGMPAENEAFFTLSTSSQDLSLRASMEIEL